MILLHFTLSRTGFRASVWRIAILADDLMIRLEKA